MRAVVPSFAKLNLDLRVLHRRPDGYHELRTIFQTISLKDTLTVDVEKTKKRSQIDLESSVDIPDNLVVRSAKLVLDHLRIHAALRLTLSKQIPMGAGLGGGSSNAAAVLLALPPLLGKLIQFADLVRLAESLGSDVPFFLQGGTALGIGKGSELYPLPEQPARHAVVVASGIHVSTIEAYQRLNRTLTQGEQSPILGEFQTAAWGLSRSAPGDLCLKNDFEATVFEAHPQLAQLTRKLRRCGAAPALMTGSGSAVFGVFPARAAAQAAANLFPADMAHLVRFVSRGQYAQTWRRALGPAAELSLFSDTSFVPVAFRTSSFRRKHRPQPSSPGSARTSAEERS